MYDVADAHGTGNTSVNKTAEVFAFLVLTLTWMEAHSKLNK